MTKPRLCLLIAGGTITMAHDPETGSLIPSTSLPDLLGRVPELNDVADFDGVVVTSIDSSNMTPELWVQIAREIEKRLDNFDGFIVTHGTDTMTYTASALSFLLQGLPKPVIVTGAQTPIFESVLSDARNNLISAAMFASQDIAEVCIFFGAELLRGNRARKFSQFDFDAFKSFNLAPLGRIGIRPKLLDHRVHRDTTKKLEPVIDLSKRAFLLKYFPGLRPEILEQILTLGYSGIVIEGVGAGHLPSQAGFTDAVHRASRKGVPIVMTTQCVVGAAEMYIYEVGRIAEQSGAISALDMTPEAALTKLTWLLSKGYPYEEIARLIPTSLAGEVTA